jgi:hypothetical protein
MGQCYYFQLYDVNSFNVKLNIFKYTCDIIKGMLYGQKRTRTLSFIK